ncbi:type II toxin-antitoxin system HicB family antitoxin [Desulfofundulus thermobenzoicus]|uniref:Type II toxin-antitoxin system HicB family antitoxin n=1 Tax=Desulfofundulus thermobenzoicus TaxID=29376 RepID=A0A6N7INB3_9FIRM|nr:type II toxin-antitoxin system HicB family antitoxin [Desulfofundulus thermobenzoicus]
MKYLAVVEQGPENYSAYLPDVPGCVATGKTVEETLRLLTEALELHLKGLKEDGLPLPLPSSVAEYIELPPRQVAG